MIPGIGALGSLMDGGAGGLSASSSMSKQQSIANQVTGGGIAFGNAGGAGINPMVLIIGGVFLAVIVLKGRK